MNTHLVFTRIDKTESIEAFARSHIENVLEKFGKLIGGTKPTVRLSMLNSPVQAGPDRFACEIVVPSRGKAPFVVKEAASNLYAAIASASMRLSALLSRGHKRRLDKFRRRVPGLNRSTLKALEEIP